MKILITGASGFIGSYFCKRLGEENKVVALVKNKEAYSNIDFFNIRNNVDILEIDLASPTLLDMHQSILLSRYDFDVVIHFAAQTIVAKSQEKPLETFHSNIMGTAHLLEYFKLLDYRQKSRKLKLFLHMSTDKVYGNREYAKEDDSYQVTCPYSASKIAVEQICKTYVNTYNFPLLMVRPCNIFGEGDFNKRIIPNVIESILRRDEATLFEGDDKMYRQYIYIEDLFNAIMFLIEKYCEKEREEWSAFNIAPNNSVQSLETDPPTLLGVSSTEEIVRALIKISGKKVKVVTKPAKNILEIPSQCIDAKQLLEAGFSTKYDLFNGLKKTFLWYKENPDYFGKMRKR
jgi:dTDP-glucose 4,6-dehydratase